MEVRLAQIGLGYWGRNLFRNLTTMGILSTAYDLNEDLLDGYRYDPIYSGIVFDTDYTQCLGMCDISGVVIATPPNTHYSIAKACLNNGKHCFIEKPMTLSSKESEELVSLAKERDLILMVGHIFLYSAEIIKLKEVIDSEDFGEVRYIYTQRLNLGKIQDCGVVFDLSAHDISILNYLLDDQCISTMVVS